MAAFGVKGHMMPPSTVMAQDIDDLILPQPTNAEVEESLDKFQKYLLSSPDGRKALLDQLARSLKQGAWNYKRADRARHILDVIEKEDGADVQGLRTLVDSLKPRIGG